MVYESICVACNPSAPNKGELKSTKEGAPSLYVGETSRSVQERAMEHFGAARRQEEDSHMYKHQRLEHNGEQQNFHFKVVSQHRTALGRQVREAIRIRRRGGAEGGVLNSKAEYNRSHIPRLMVELEQDEAKRQREEQEQLDKEEMEKILRSMDMTWEEKKSRTKELQEKKRMRNSEHKEDGAKPKRRRTMQYTLLEEEWGVEKSMVEEEEVTVEGAEDGQKDGGTCSNVIVQHSPCNWWKIC